MSKIWNEIIWNTINIFEDNHWYFNQIWCLRFFIFYFIFICFASPSCPLSLSSKFALTFEIFSASKVIFALSVFHSFLPSSLVHFLALFLPIFFPVLLLSLLFFLPLFLFLSLVLPFFYIGSCYGYGYCSRIWQPVQSLGHQGQQI